MKDQIAPYKEYWAIYGGLPSLLRSIYLWASVAITALCFPIWFQEGWWELSVSLLPSLIGFLIGTFGLMLAFGGDYFKSLMANVPGNSLYSALDKVAATFCHFLVIQFAALLTAMLARAFWSLELSKSEWLLKLPVWCSTVFHICTLLFWGFGFLLLTYSAACALASVMTIFRIAREITIVENVSKMPLSGGNSEEKSKKPLR